MKAVCVRNFALIFHILLIYICACGNDGNIYVSNPFLYLFVRSVMTQSFTSYILEGRVLCPVDTYIGIYFFTPPSELLRGPLSSLSNLPVG
jgi:hypothetical protein